MLLALVLSAAPLAMEPALAAFSKAYNTAFDRLKVVELSDTQTRITRLKDAGKPFQPELDRLRKRQGEVSDLLVRAIELKNLGVAQKRAALVEEATRLLVDADARARVLPGDVKKLDDRLTAAGAPVIDPGPPRDPNARD